MKFVSLELNPIRFLRIVVGTWDVDWNEIPLIGTYVVSTIACDRGQESEYSASNKAMVGCIT